MRRRRGSLYANSTTDVTVGNVDLFLATNYHTKVKEKIIHNSVKIYILMK